MKRIYIFLILVAVAFTNTGCFLLMGSSSSSSSEPSKPTVDYAPQQIQPGAYFEFDHPQAGRVHITFQINSVADLADCSASNGRINAAYYKYNGFNMATLTFNYSPNGGMASQYKAELDFRYETGGTIVFLGTDQTASFKYRP